MVRKIALAVMFMLLMMSSVFAAAMKINDKYYECDGTFSITYTITRGDLKAGKPYSYKVESDDFDSKSSVFLSDKDDSENEGTEVHIGQEGKMQRICWPKEKKESVFYDRTINMQSCRVIPLRIETPPVVDKDFQRDSDVLIYFVEYEVIHEHKAVTYDKTKKASFTEDGYMKGTCRLCGEEFEKKINKIGIVTDKKYTYCKKNLHPRTTAEYLDSRYIQYKDCYHAGTGKVRITIPMGNEYYEAGDKIFTFKINKAKSRMYAKLKNGKNDGYTIKASKYIKLYNKVGKVTFKKVSGSGKLTLSKNGTIKISKKIKKGKYKIVFKVSDTGNSDILKGTIKEKITFKIG